MRRLEEVGFGLVLLLSNWLVVPTILPIWEVEHKYAYGFIHGVLTFVIYLTGSALYNFFFSPTVPNGSEHQ